MGLFSHFFKSASPEPIILKSNEPLNLMVLPPENFTIEVQPRQEVFLFNQQDSLTLSVPGSHSLIRKDIELFQYVLFVRDFAFNHYNWQYEIIRDEKIYYLSGKISLILNSKEKLAKALIREYREHHQSIHFPQTLLQYFYQELNNNIQEMSVADFEQDLHEIQQFLNQNFNSRFSPLGLHTADFSLIFTPKDEPETENVNEAENITNEPKILYDDQRRYYFYQNNDRKGPLSGAEIQALLDNQEINGQTSVWAFGMKSWQPLSSLGLFRLK